MKTDSDFLNFIYKDRKVPIGDIESGKYQEVRSLIGKLCNALNGDAYPAGNPRPHISHTRFSPEESERINRRIVELREGPTMMSFKEIAKELNVGLNKDAVQKRYVNNADRLRSAAQAKIDVLLTTPFSDSQKPENPEISVLPEGCPDGTVPTPIESILSKEQKTEDIEQVSEAPALQEAEPEHSENTTTQENQAVQKAEEVKPKLQSVEDLNDAEFEQLKKRVYSMDDEDLDVKQISEKLRVEGIDFPWPRVRAMLAKRAKERKAAREVDLSPEAEKARLEGKIWNLYTQAKMSPMEIAGHLTVRIEEVEAIIAKLQGHK